MYGIDDNMHPQKQKSEVSHENVIEKPKHFHWKPMHNEQLENLLNTFPSSTLKDIANKFFINNSTLELKFTQVYSHLHHLHKKKCKSCKKYELLFKQHRNINKYKCCP